MTFISRLQTGRPSAPHPSLTLSLLPFLLESSPSPTLSSEPARKVISSLLLGPARALSSHAFATSDLRIVDVVASNAIRALALYIEARFLDGWIESSSGAAMAWAAGLGKLGGVAVRFSPGKLSTARLERIRVETLVRDVRRKGQVVKPAGSLKEHFANVALL